MKQLHALAAGLLTLIPSTALWADTKKLELPELSTAIRKPIPESIEDLKEIQKQTKAVYDLVSPAVVGIFNNGAAGSGVIVSKDGLVLTAGHVSGEPNKPVTLVMPDGKRLKGVTLGRWGEIDSGMIRITDKYDKGEFPYAKMANMADFTLNDWCVALGHPGGYREGRTPVVRVGKLLRVSDKFLQSDCALVGGDSGGPLFDMRGRVIGIHSRIQDNIANNLHVPIGTFRQTWARLVKGSDIGAAWFGVTPDGDSPGQCKLGDVTKNSPADKAGLKVGDVILKFDQTSVSTYADMKKILSDKDVGEEIELEVKRNDETVKLKVKFERRPDMANNRGPFGK
jgi:serine protease Do